MGRCFFIFFLAISTLGCDNGKESKLAIVAQVNTEHSPYTDLVEEMTKLPINETLMDSLVLDGNTTVYILKKEAGNFGVPGWFSDLSLIEKTNGKTTVKFNAKSGGGLDGVRYLDSSLAKIKIGNEVRIVFFYIHFVDGLDPEKLILVNTNLVDTETSTCLYHWEDGEMECDSIKTKELQLFSEPIRKAYKADNDN